MPNKSILIGYTDSARLVGAKIIAGPGLTMPEKTEAIWEDARERHIFPKDVKFLERYDVDQPQGTEEFISEEVAGTIQGSFQSRLKMQEAQIAHAEASNLGQKHFTAANKKFHDAATVRNAALGAVASPRNILAASGLDEKEKARLQKQIDELQPKADAAVAAFNAVLEQFNVIRNPKSTPEQKLAAYIALGVVKAPAVADSNQQPMQEPEEFKGKTIEELLPIAAALKLELKPDATREQIIVAITNAPANAEGRKQPGFWGTLFGKK